VRSGNVSNEEKKTLVQHDEDIIENYFFNFYFM